MELWKEKYLLRHSEPQIVLENLEKNSMGLYASFRSLYLQDRQQKILNSKATTETMDDGDWEEIDSQ